ncbi:MAG: hypothetical protein ABJN40_18845 [Sneathiella sp.]
MLDTSYIPIRRDFVFDETCHICPRKLTSNIATIMRDSHGQEVPFGPICARAVLDLEKHILLRQIPDFTKAAPTQTTGKSGDNISKSKSDGKNESAKSAGQQRRAITYLLLRQRKLAHIPAAGYDQLSGYADTFDATGSLTEDAVRHLLNIDRKSDGTKFGFDNLQALYGYDRCIARTLLSVPPRKQDWLKDVQAFLHTRLYLTQPQAQGVENWFKYIPGHQPLDPRGFQWAWRK